MLGRISLIAVLALGSAVANACPTGTVKYAENEGRTICRFASNDVLGQTITLTPDNDYILIRQPGSTGADMNGTYIGGDNTSKSTLIILPGVRVYGNESTFLSISRGSEIRAEGTKEAPIVFTSSKPDAARGLWGGLVINGNAPVNSSELDAGCNGVVYEGVKERKVCFGGSNAGESSGSLKYVRVEYGGYPVAADKEINGFTFNGVGEGTSAEYLQAHMIADDCFEFFGGTINLRYLICTGGDDDGIDSDFGYNGRIQFALVQYANDKGDNGFEWDNHPKEANASPRANPIVSNITVLGGPVSGYGMILRKGTSASIMNSIFTGFKKACIDIDDPETFDHGGLTIKNSVIHCEKNFEEEAGDKWTVESWFASTAGNMIQNPDLDGYFLKANSPLLSAGATPDDLFFDDVNYVGAFSTSSDDWTAGWSVQIPEALRP